MTQTEKVSTHHRNLYDTYLQWVATNEKPVLFKRWIIFAVLSIVFILAATFIPFGGDYLEAALALPAPLLIFAICLGFAHWRHLETNSQTVKMKHSVSKRRKMAAILTLLIVIASMFLSQYIPYALGGTILLTALCGIYNMMRATPEEKLMEEAGIPDPRDYFGEETSVGDTEEETDILDDDFSWDDETEDFDLGEEEK